MWSSEAAAGGLWVADDAEGPLGFAAFDPRGLAYHWLRPYREQPEVGIFGPLGVVERARGRGLGATLLRAALFSLRERGYRTALIPAVGDPRIVAFYEREARARIVERFAVERPGRRYRTAVLASGNGSNFQAVVDGARGGTLPLEVTTLVVNRPSAFARERARNAGVAERLVAWDHGAETREAYDARVIEAVAASAPELVLLLGWMHVMPEAFVTRFPHTLNVHPAFLPFDPRSDTVTLPDFTTQHAFRGVRAVDDALAAGVGWVGASVHRVGVDVDRGVVLARAPLPIVSGEAREQLDARLHALEHRVLATAIRRWTWEQPT